MFTAVNEQYGAIWGMHMNGYLLWRAANLWQRTIRVVLSPHGITPVQFLLLSGLHELGNTDTGPVTQSVLANHCGTDPMMTSQVLRILEKAGLVRRATHDGDKRAVAVAISESGTALVNRVDAEVRDTDERFHAPLSEHSETFGDALQLLNGIKPRRRVRANSG